MTARPHTVSYSSIQNFLFLVTISTSNYSHQSFYSASALLAMQGAVIAGAIPTVCHSITFGYCAQTNEDMILWF